MSEQACGLCYGREVIKRSDGVVRAVRHSPDAESFICSACIQRLLALPGGKVRDAHTKAVERGRVALASAIQSLTEEEYGAEQVGGDLERTRTMRTARLASNGARA